MIFRRENKFKTMFRFFKSARRWSKLRKLQRIIVPLEAIALEESERAFEEFLDLCESDEHIAPFMQEHHLTRDDLKRIYHTLKETSVGKWIDDHYAALSTIAYLEPLSFFVTTEQNGVRLSEIITNLLEYWEGEVPRGSLLEKMKK